MEVGELFVSGYFGGGGDFSSEIIMTEAKNGENFTVDDLLDFSNEDGRTSDGSLDNIAGNSAESSSVTGNSYVSGENHSSSANFTGSRSFSADYHFSGELSIPYDDVAQLEWLSNFVEESFSTDQKIQNLHSKVHIFSGSGSKSSTASSRPPTSSPTISNSIFQSDASVPGKARSKRPRVAPGDWTTRLFHLTPKAAAQPKKRQISNSETELSGRKCLHCEAEKTPQWRTGPMGQKTLCNACGVRYKSGRLVPEYRPAASPSFVLTKHSNSHRKVLELRKQKVMQLEAGQQLPFLGQSSVFGAPSPCFRQMI